jgi:hypothetical protein
MQGADTLTVILLTLALMPAWWAWRITAELGTDMTAWNRKLQRVAFAALVYLAAFGSVLLVLWRCGVSVPSLDAAAEGPGRAVFWVPPFTLVWSAATYWVLRLQTWTGRHDEKPS